LNADAREKRKNRLTADKKVCKKKEALTAA
jgi:hypothetical protein